MLKNSIEYIYAVYQHKSFSRASKEKFISQPALSSAILKEEARFGCSFFDRSNSPIELTQAGRYLIDAIEKVKAIEIELERSLRELITEHQTTINIGASSFFCNRILPSMIKKFKVRHPESIVNIIEATGSDLVDSLAGGGSDICISVEALSESVFDISPIGVERIVIAIPSSFQINQKIAELRFSPDPSADPEAEWLQAPRLPVSELAEVPFLLLKPGNDMRDRALRIFGRSGIEPEIIMNLDQLTVAYHMAAIGLGATFTRIGLMDQSVGDLFYYIPDDEDCERTVWIARKKDRPLPNIADDLVDVLTDGSISALLRAPLSASLSRTITKNM